MCSSDLENEKIFPGGKGINVSIVLNNLGIESKVLGFVAGFTGNKIEEMINKLGVKTEFINLKNGNSRINIKIDSDNKETAINCTGPKIEKEELRTLIEKLEMLKDDDILVLAGSIPNGIENNIYEIICERLQNKKIKEESFRSMELLSLFISSARLPFIFLLSQKEYPSRQHTAQRKQYSH